MSSEYLAFKHSSAYMVHIPCVNAHGGTHVHDSASNSFVSPPAVFDLKLTSLHLCLHHSRLLLDCIFLLPSLLIQARVLIHVFNFCPRRCRFFLKDQEGEPLLRILLESEKKRLELGTFTINTRKRKRKHYSYVCHRLSQFGIEVSNFPRAL
jgi:hypothetical protein